MKLGKAELTVIIIALLCLAFTAGFFTGRKTSDGVISVSAQNTVTPAAKNTDNPVGTGSDNSPDISVTLSGPVNINSASEEDLTTLPGIGEALAKRIIAYREENGAFIEKESIMNVYGIGENIYARIKDLITTG